MAARYNGNPSVIEALLNGGADLREQADRKYRPLHVAARYNENPAIIETLIKAGANLEAEDDGPWFEKGADDQRYRPLHVAARYNENPAIFETLIKAGANLEARSEWKHTPLHVAARYNENPAIIETLIKAGANLEARSGYRRTPLHYAAFNQNPDVVKNLLDAGADQRAWDKEDRTPLQAALQYDGASHPTVREVLRAAWTRQPESQKMAEQARRKANSGPGFLESAIGIAGGTAIAAAGGGTEEAMAAGTIFAEGVISGQSPAGSTARAPAVAPTGSVGSRVGSGQCEIPGYPRPADVQNLGLSWCPATVDFQARVFALQAAGAKCAIANGSSSTPEQIQARRQEIQAACARLAALGVSNCRCP